MYTSKITRVGFSVHISPREALDIQAKQIARYERSYPSLRLAAEKANDIIGLEMDRAYPASELHNRIPRGCRLGDLIGKNF